MADTFLEQLKENERRKKEPNEDGPKFGGVLKSSLPLELVNQIDKIEKLTPEEREILLVAKISDSETHLKSIRNNVLFFFWMFIIPIILGAIVLIIRIIANN